MLTNHVVTTQEQAVELIDWYRARWEIEIYFHVLKNGCEVEALQLSSIERLERALALFMVVAWRITYLMRKGRTCPELAAWVARSMGPVTPVEQSQEVRVEENSGRAMAV